MQQRPIHKDYPVVCEDEDYPVVHEDYPVVREDEDYPVVSDPRFIVFVIMLLIVFRCMSNFTILGHWLNFALSLSL